MISIRRTTLFAFALAGSTSAASFASLPDGVVRSADGRSNIGLPLPGSTVYAPPLPSAGTKTIFSNFAPLYASKGYYASYSGLSIDGPNAPDGLGQIWYAVPFVSPVNATVTEVDAAVTFIRESRQAVDGVVINLFADARGVPGRLLQSWNVANLPSFPSCCSVAVGKGKAGVPVVARTTYGIGLTTNANETLTTMNWNYCTLDQITAPAYAFNGGSGWKKNGTVLPSPAFAVLGK